MALRGTLVIVECCSEWPETSAFDSLRPLANQHFGVDPSSQLLPLSPLSGRFLCIRFRVHGMHMSYDHRLLDRLLPWPTGQRLIAPLNNVGISQSEKIYSNLSKETYSYYSGFLIQKTQQEESVPDTFRYRLGCISLVCLCLMTFGNAIQAKDVAIVSMYGSGEVAFIDIKKRSA
jgi:hypothetical protein